MVATMGTNTAAILKGSWGTLQTFSGNWSHCRQAVTPVKPGGSVTCQTTSNSLVGDGSSDLVTCIFDSSGHHHWAILSPELYEVFA